MAKRKPYVDGDHVTPIIFRKFPASQGGEVIALFPYLAGGTDGYTCESFMHHGQHGIADPGIMRVTRPATQAEAWDLICELTSSPYHYPPVRIMHRFTSHAADARRRQTERPA